MDESRTTTGEGHTPEPTPTGERRFTHGLLYDVFAVLKAHGYAPPSDEGAHGKALTASMLAVYHLTRTYEGTEGAEPPAVAQVLAAIDGEVTS